MNDKLLIKGRRKARKIALQALYQQHISKSELSDIIAEYCAVHRESNTDFEYFTRLMQGIAAQQHMLDEKLLPLLDRAIEDVYPIELVVLRMGSFELLEVRELPYRVILDEAINLAKTFGSKDGHKYVNGILHSLAKQVRSFELGGS